MSVGDVVVGIIRVFMPLVRAVLTGIWMTLILKLVEFDLSNFLFAVVVKVEVFNPGRFMWVHVLCRQNSGGAKCYKRHCLR